MIVPRRMIDMPELSDLNIRSLARMGMLAEEFVNDEGEIESPDMDPFAEDDEEAFERFFDAESDAGDTGPVALLDDFQDDPVGFDDTEDEVQSVAVDQSGEDENGDAQSHGESQNYSQAAMNDAGGEIGLDRQLRFATAISGASKPTNDLNVPTTSTPVTEMMGVERPAIDPI